MPRSTRSLAQAGRTIQIGRNATCRVNPVRAALFATVDLGKDEADAGEIRLINEASARTRTGHSSLAQCLMQSSFCDEDVAAVRIVSTIHKFEVSVRKKKRAHCDYFPRVPSK